MAERHGVNSVIHTNYDESGQVLYISFGEPVEAYCEDWGDVLVRRSFADDTIVGITMLGVRLDDLGAVLRAEHEGKDTVKWKA